MTNYNIVSIRTAKYGKYSSVLHVIARKKGLLSSLFFSSQATFILSTESPIAVKAQSAYKHDRLWKVDITMFKLAFYNGAKYQVEKKIDQYESIVEYKAREACELKAKQERELKEAEERRKEERRKQEEEQKEKEWEKRINETFDNATFHTVNMSQIRVVADEDASFSEQMAAIAGNANICFLMGNKDEYLNNAINLYNMVHGYNSHKLKSITSKDGQCIGLAFIKMAMFFSNGDSRVNEIAAQNAFYCIVKNYKIDGNTYALPALFTLLLKKPQTLTDELYSVNPDSSLVGMGGMTPSAPYRRRDRAMKNRIPVMKFLLQKFYDESKKVFTIDTTLPYHIPSNGDVATFLNDYAKSDYASQSDSISIGESYLDELFENIEEQLNL